MAAASPLATRLPAEVDPARRMALARSQPFAEDTDDALVLRLADGCDGAMAALSDRHLRPVLACAWRILGDRAEAEDVAQETFVRLLRKAPDWQPEGPALRSWLFRVATNLCLDRRRVRARVAPMPDDIERFEDRDKTPLDDDLAIRYAVRRAIRDLPDRQRAALVLVHFHGLSGREVANALGVSAEAVESLLARARRRLRTVLAPHMKNLLEVQS